MREDSFVLDAFAGAQNVDPLTAAEARAHGAAVGESLVPRAQYAREAADECVPSIRLFEPRDDSLQGASTAFSAEATRLGFPEDVTTAPRAFSVGG